MAVRWLAVAAKDADDIPPGTATALPTGGFNVVNLYLDYRPSEDTILAFGIDNLFNEFYTRYLDVRTLSVGPPPAFRFPHPVPESRSKDRSRSGSGTNSSGEDDGTAAE